MFEALPRSKLISQKNMLVRRIEFLEMVFEKSTHPDLVRAELRALATAVELFESAMETALQYDKEVARVMLCYMSPFDALHYAAEARMCVGAFRAYEAAASGAPYHLPWRGTHTVTGTCPNESNDGTS